MKIFSNQQIQELDQQTIQKHYNDSWGLMEKAAKTLFESLEKQELKKDRQTIIFCGKGNNGGDGLALARILSDKKYIVKTFLLKATKYSKDNLINQDLLHESKFEIQYFNCNEQLHIENDSLIIDALFGTGLQNSLDSEWENIFNQIQDSNPYKIISVDLPSGLLNDQAMEVNSPCLKSDVCLSFQFPKLALLLPDNKNRVDSFRVLDIGLDEATIETMPTSFHFITKELIQSFLKSPNSFSHKGSFGHCIIIGGSYGSIGAPILSAKAALKSGSGLVTVFAPKCAYEIVQSNINEAFCKTDPNEHFISSFESLKKYDSYAIGMGLGSHPQTAIALKKWLKNAPENSIVLDADALNILALEDKPFEWIPKGSVLTPHPKELERLISSWENDYEKLKIVKEIALKYQLTILIKGAHSSIVCPDGLIYFNSTGNWGMATAGSGDVLSGIIASLIGQAYSPTQATIIAVFLHGLAGDFAKLNIHPHSITAGDIINNISNAYFFITP
ncbi:MAG TPA: NAD(P)H-hydrate dehydratase [Edaphocola sp.]|nr:NAD(P)H-hydrate dehydratase [Edaphocola sp.]